jgi:hypothetical protein
MHFWNLSSWTACGPFAQVLRLKRPSASRSMGPVAFWELRKIFSRLSFEEIFDGYFKRDPGQGPEKFEAGGISLNPTLQILVTRV